MSGIVVKLLSLVSPEGGLDIVPSYQSPEAAGADLRAANTTPIVLAPGARALVPTGVAIELPQGFEAQVRPRSGLALRHGVTTLNAPGTIDSDYRGEIGVLLINHGEQPFIVENGARIAQIVVAPVERVRFEMVECLRPSDRQSGGFGHTGTK